MTGNQYPHAGLVEEGTPVVAPCVLSKELATGFHAAILREKGEKMHTQR
jgi:hypothetical protein